MITEIEKQKLITEIINQFKDANLDCFNYDIQADIDSSLTFSENYEHITQKLKAFLPGEITKREMANTQESYRIQEAQQINPEELLTYDNLNKVKTIAIFGDCGSGKTSLAFKTLEQFKPYKKCYFIKHPSPTMIKQLGYYNLSTLQELEHINNCVVYIDEPQLLTAIYEKHSNNIIGKLCSLARQRNITLIVSSSDTRVFGKANESYFDLWLIKDIEYESVKNGSKIKNIIKDNCFIDPKGFRLERNEYLSGSRTLRDFNGKHKFELIKQWSDKLSNAYNV